MTDDIEQNRMKPTGFVRLGGLAILLGLAIHIVANMVLKTFPSEDFTSIELQDYLSNEAGNWSIVHGLRYVAIVFIIIFSGALFVKTRDIGKSKSTGWAIIGLLGAGLMMSNLLMANGIEILAFYDFNRLSEQENLFWLLFYLTRVLFAAELVTWSILIFGFSMAGFYTGTIQKWLVLFGILSSIACLLSSIFIISVLQDGWASYLIEAASLMGLLWFISIGLYMLFQRN
jgi:hypothetical protein